MGLFDALFKGRGTRYTEGRGYWQTLTAYTPIFTSRSGSAYESLLVRASIDSRARHFSTLKIDYIGTAKPKLKSALTKGPNAFQTYSQFLYRISTILDMHNTCVILPVVEGEFYELVGYYPVLPTLCELVDVDGEPWLRYTFANGKKGACPLSEVGILTKHQYRDDFFGEENTPLDPTLDLMHMDDQGISEAIKNSATYRFMAQLINFAKSDDIVKERKNFNNLNFKTDSEAEGKGGILLFPHTWKDIKQIESKPYVVDPEEKKLIKENVFDYFGTNENVIQNKASGEELDSFFLGAIQPISIQLSQVLTKMTFSDREKATNEILITANRLQYMSNDKKISMATQLGDRGMLMIDEIRELFSLPALANGAGKRLPVRGEYYFINEDGTTTKTEDDNNAN